MTKILKFLEILFHCLIIGGHIIGIIINDDITFRVFCLMYIVAYIGFLSSNEWKSKGLFWILLVISLGGYALL